jgi:hypothetical protein
MQTAVAVTAVVRGQMAPNLDSVSCMVVYLSLLLEHVCLKADSPKWVLDFEVMGSLVSKEHAVVGSDAHS